VSTVSRLSSTIVTSVWKAEQTAIHSGSIYPFQLRVRTSKEQTSIWHIWELCRPIGIMVEDLEIANW